MSDLSILPKDQNYMRAAGFESSSTAGLVMAGKIDEVTGRILVDSAAGGSGTVTSVSVVTANGVSGSVATATTTPAITLTLGAITPSSVNGASSTEVGYLVGVTSAIQTQLNAKQSTITFGTGVQAALGVNIGSTGAPVLFNGALGTPSSGTVTNLTGTASININGTVGATTPTTGTFTTITANTGIEVQNTDTTITRSASGIIAVEGVAVPTISSTSTLTNKRVTPRVGTVADAATITPTADDSDMYTVTALAQAATIAAPSGTPTNGQKLIIRILDNGTARALTWNAIYQVIGTTLPTTTVLSKYTYVGCIYNSASSKWDVVAVTTQT
jgi:hypothetical protein